MLPVDLQSSYLIRGLVVILSLFFCSCSAPIQKKIESKKETSGYKLGKKISKEVFLEEANIDLAVFKGQYLLIDFWASWCPPCRKAHPNLKKLYQKHVIENQQNFDIISISLDEKEQKWQQAILTDGLNWGNQVRLTKSWDSKLCKQLNIDELPFNFIINPEGIIIGKNIHGENLKNFLKGIFQKN